MSQTTRNCGDLGVYVYSREIDGVEISIIKSTTLVVMYGPKGRKFFNSLIEAQICAENNGFQLQIENCFI